VTVTHIFILAMMKALRLLLMTGHYPHKQNWHIMLNYDGLTQASNLHKGYIVQTNCHALTSLNSSQGLTFHTFGTGLTRNLTQI
jgi:hypothetical protein